MNFCTRHIYNTNRARHAKKNSKATLEDTLTVAPKRESTSYWTLKSNKVYYSCVPNYSVAELYYFVFYFENYGS